MSRQSSCKGLMVFQQVAGDQFPNYEATCYGTARSVQPEHAVDLHNHHQSREMSMEYKDAAIYSMHCLGASVYQVGPDSAGETPPPFCLGVEFLRYSQALIQQQQRLQQHAANIQNVAPPFPPHVHEPAATSGHQQTSSEMPSAYHTAQQQHTFNNSSSSLQESDDEEQLSMLERMQRRRAQINEQLEGKDPLWFAKAFSNRAALNWESMKRVAGQIAAQAKADLGLAERPDEAE